MQVTGKATISDDVRKQNRLRILQAFRQAPSLSRTQLARATGLSPGTITNISTQLLAEDILRTTPGAAGAETDAGPRHGRPQVQLALNPDHARLVSGSLTFGRLTLRLTDYAGGNVQSLSRAFDTDGRSGAPIAAGLSGLIRDLTGGAAPDIVSFGVQGTTARDRDRVLWSPILSDDALTFPAALASETGGPVLIENDCALIARALDHLQAGRVGTFGAVLMSYGIGMGLYVNGSLFGGQASSATEFGHLPYRPGGAQCRCGKRGCIEAYASDYAIWRAATGMDPGLLPKSPVTPGMISAVIERAAAGEGPERAALREAATALGIGLAMLFTLFDPFPVTFIGPGSALIPVMEDDLRAALRENFRFRQRPHLRFATDPDDTGLTEQGARIAAQNRLDAAVAFGA